MSSKLEGQDKDVLFAAQGTGGGSFLPTLLMMALLFGAMYFLFIRPNKRRRQQMEEMQSSIGPGDEVMTIGGLLGTVEEIDDDYVTLEVAPGVTNRYTRGAISKVVTAASRPDELDESDEPDEPVAAQKTSIDKVVDTD